VLNPVFSVFAGILLLEETLSLPVWHKVVAWSGLALAMWGAIAISLSRKGDVAAEEPAARAAPAV
jgi:EamA domain-containing membrane protein RarD